jgi:Na+/H+ antiporter NhaB
VQIIPTLNYAFLNNILLNSVPQGSALLELFWACITRWSVGALLISLILILVYILKIHIVAKWNYLEPYTWLIPIAIVLILPMICCFFFNKKLPILNAINITDYIRNFINNYHKNAFNNSQKHNDLKLEIEDIIQKLDEFEKTKISVDITQES